MHDMGTVCSVALVMSDSTILWIIAWQFLRPWDFPGKNTGVGCHAVYQGGLPDPGTERASPASLVLQEDSSPAEPSGKPWVWHFKA